MELIAMFDSDTFAGQRNHAQREIAFRHPWVFHLDADEQMTAELAAERRDELVRPEIEPDVFLGRRQADPFSRARDRRHIPLVPVIDRHHVTPIRAL